MKITLGILAALLVLTALAFVLIYKQNATVPELGVENGRFKPLSDNPNGVSTQARDPGKQVAPWPMKASTEETLQAIERAVQAYGGGEVKQKTSDYLYVVFTTPLMKYHDDVEFWLDPATGQVQFRSASRAGKSDLGLNRERYEKLAALYQQ